MMLHLAAPLQFVDFYAKIRKNSYKPHMLWNYSSLATFLSLTVKAHVRSVTHGQLRKQQRRGDRGEMGHR